MADVAGLLLPFPLALFFSSALAIGTLRALFETLLSLGEVRCPSGPRSCVPLAWRLCAVSAGRFALLGQVVGLFINVSW